MQPEVAAVHENEMEDEVTMETEVAAVGPKRK